jgi:uncharacterized Tic20 family protein
MSSTDTPPPAPLDSNDKLWIALSHLSLLLGVGILLPLIIYVVKKSDSPEVASQSREALNFHISVYIYAFIFTLLSALFIGIPLLILLGLGSVVLAILATIKAVDGRDYRYPLTLRLVH